MDVRPAADWKGLAGKLRGGVGVFLGMSDTGKTTLIRYLAGRLLSWGETLALVDSDIGQSSVGPPGAVSMRTCRRPGDLERAGPERMVFVGTANPARSIPAVVDAARRMVEEARAAGAGTVLVDTTGLVRGGLGKALKLAKVRAIGPDAVVALERERGELEHIISSLEGLEGVRVFRLRASRHARKRTATERKRNREARLKRYLAPSRTLRLKAGRLEVLSGGGEGVDLFSAEPGTVVGLNRGRETLALGVYAGRSGGRALIRTPLKDARGLRKVIVGELKVDYA